MPRTVKRTLIVGLDCMAPELVFHRWREHLPTFSALMDDSRWGRLESTIPAITVPAWMVMMTSQNPGRLGFYGFRNRRDHSYDRMIFATSNLVTEPTIWDHFGNAGLSSIVVGLPPSYPVKPIRGAMISCFLTPSITSDFTHPPELKQEILDKFGTYHLDADQFRTEDKQSLLERLYVLCDNRFDVSDYLLSTKPWEFAIFVEMGVDRLHHGFWKYMDPLHPKHEAGNPFENAIRDYYIHVDHRLKTLMEKHVDSDTALLVVSDHGAKRMIGGLCFNDWLIREGYLTLKHNAEGITAFRPQLVDWERTTAWGDGGYYGRLFLNVRGREPEGIIPPENYEKVLNEIIGKLEAMTDPEGKMMGTRVFRPSQIYDRTTGVPPDGIVYFGNLDWRSVGTVGNPSIFTFENDTGPDDANHAQHGMYIAHVPGLIEPGEDIDASIMDVAPTVMSLHGMPVPREMEGRTWVR